MLLRRVPLLEVDGMAIGQCVAIVNYIGRRAGMEGRDAEEFALSQVLLAEGARTPDLLGEEGVEPLTTAGMGDAILDNLDRLAT